MVHTTAIHGDDHIASDPDIAPPIRVSTTFDRTDQDDLVYRRDQHETTARLEAVIGALESGSAVAYSSGMAAIAAVVGYVQPARVSLPDDVYHHTRVLLEREQHRGRLTLASAPELGAGDLMWLETPSNPRCLVADIEVACAEAHANGAVVAVDSTFATPVLQQPLALGADFVVHSTTKFIGGHSDSMGGVVVVPSAESATSLQHHRSIDGSTPGALDVWLALRGVRTLPLRVERQSATATRVASFLAGKVATVYHPSLGGHPGADVAARQMSGPGSILSFELDSLEEARAVLGRCRVFRNATSVGGVESLADPRHLHDPTAPPGLVRLSIGLEDAADLIADLEQALAHHP